MSDSEPMVILAVVVFGAMYGIGVLTRWRRKRRGLRSVRTSSKLERTSIAAAVDGQRVRLVGAVAGTPAALTAPITGRPCVAFHAVIEAHSDSPLEPWMVVAEERGAVDFTLTDASGEARVVVFGSELAYDAGVVEGVVSLQLASAHAMLARHRDDPRARPFARHFRFRERAFAIGGEVAVVGVATVRADADPADRVEVAAAPLVSDAPALRR